VEFLQFGWNFTLGSGPFSPGGFPKAIRIKGTGFHRAHFHLFGTAAAAIQALAPDAFKRGIEMKLAVFGSASHDLENSKLDKIYTYKKGKK